MYLSLLYRGKISSSSGFETNKSVSLTVALPEYGELTIQASHKDNKTQEIEFKSEGALLVTALAPDFIKVRRCLDDREGDKNKGGMITVKHGPIEITCNIEVAEVVVFKLPRR